jgi:pentapeptide repeat protein
MPNEEHLAILKRGVQAWNQWREVEPDIMPDLTEAKLSEANLSGADLWRANLSGADLTDARLSGTNLRRAHLRDAHLRGANLWKANLWKANLTGANLTGANLTGANLTVADLSNANLSGANLRNATLVETNCTGAHLTGCSVYGIAAWNVNLVGAQQADLVITPRGEPVITVDDLEVAQFIYLLLRNENIRHVIKTITSKAVLILGRFTPERKAVLDALQEALRTRDRLPIVFDFTLPRTQTTLETVSTLAHMARFVIADLTDAKSILQELQAIVPNSPSILVQPILLASQEEPGMFDFFRRFPWVLEPYRYHSQEEVLAALDAKILAPVEARYGS